MKTEGGRRDEGYSDYFHYERVIALWKEKIRFSGKVPREKEDEYLGFFKFIIGDVVNPELKDVFRYYFEDGYLAGESDMREKAEEAASSHDKEVEEVNNKIAQELKELLEDHHSNLMDKITDIIG